LSRSSYNGGLQLHSSLLSVALHDSLGGTWQHFRSESFVEAFTPGKDFWTDIVTNNAQGRSPEYRLKDFATPVPSVSNAPYQLTYIVLQ
jgi:hypothetical protein